MSFLNSYSLENIKLMLSLCAVFPSFFFFVFNLTNFTLHVDGMEIVYSVSR